MNVGRSLSALGARALKTRWLVRAPIHFYRAGLGFLFGTRLLMLEHIGRSSGARRYVVLEVVDRPSPDRYVIVSGFGRGAQWYRNVCVHPEVRVSCGLRRNVPATAVPLSDDESAAVLAHYAEAHPRAWRNLRSTIESAVSHPVDSLPMACVASALTARPSRRASPRPRRGSGDDEGPRRGRTGVMRRR